MAKVGIESSHNGTSSSRSGDSDQASEIMPSSDTNEERSLRADHPFVDPPDGGARAWIQVLAAFLLYCLTWGIPVSFGVSQLYYTSSLHLPASQVSWIGSLQLFLTFGTSIFSGRLTDAGYARATATLGSFLVVLGLLTTSVAKRYWQILLAQGLCVGFGMGLMYVPPVAVVSSYFKERRSFALTIVSAGGGVGGLIFPSIIQFLTPEIEFAWAMRVAGFVALAIGVVANLLLRPYLPPRKTGALVEWAAFREKTYVLCLIGFLLYMHALFFGFFYINSYAKNIIGFSNVESVQLLLINNAVGIIGRPVSGFVADKYLGPLNLFIGLLIAIGSLLYAWIGVTTRADMYAFSVVMGFASGAAQGIFVGVLASLTKDQTKAGTRFGMVTTLCAFSSLAGPPIAGAIIDSSGGKYQWAQVYMGSVMITASLVLVYARIVATGWTWRAKI